MLAPKLLARDVRAVVRFDETSVTVQSVEAEVAGGRMTAELTAERRPDGLAAHGHVRFVNANADELLPGDGVLSGRITLDMTAKGSGRSASALIGSLAGNGSFTLQNGKVEHLDPTVFDAVIRAVDGGLPVDAARVRTWLDKALAARALPVDLAEGTITLTAGQARLSNIVVHTPAAELTAGGSVNLADGGLEARLTLAGPSGIGGIAQAPPKIAIALKGPVANPQRTIDVAALSSWLALRSVEQQSKKLEVLEGRASATDARSDDKPAPVAPTHSRTGSDRRRSGCIAAASRGPAACQAAAPSRRRNRRTGGACRSGSAPSRRRVRPRQRHRRRRRDPRPPPFNLLPFLSPRT